MAKRVSVINFKGGVGKTTLTFELASGLARYHGSKVLLVDMDHQSSLSIVCLTAGPWLNLVKQNKTVTEIFKPFIQPGHLPGKDIISKGAIKQSVQQQH